MREEDIFPVLRVANTSNALSWYERLGFHLEVEHAKGPELRARAVINRGDLRMCLSEHQDDGPPEGVVYLRVLDVDPIAKEFNVTVQKVNWFAREVELRDPDGNRIRVISVEGLRTPAASTP